LGALNINLLSRYSDDSLSLQGTVTYSNVPEAPALDNYPTSIGLTLRFLNNMNAPQQATFFAIMRNDINQTVQLVSVRTNLAAEQATPVSFVFLNEPDSFYTITVLSVSSSGVAFSVPIRLLFETTNTSSDQPSIFGT
jgi:hypothetical protein